MRDTAPLGPEDLPNTHALAETLVGLEAPIHRFETSQRLVAESDEDPVDMQCRDGHLWIDGRQTLRVDQEVERYCMALILGLLGQTQAFEHQLREHVDAEIHAQ